MNTWRQYRDIKYGEFFIVGGDCSQGGSDENVSQFLSKSKLDIPLVYASQGVGATMTPEIHAMLERLYDITGIPPLVGFERNMGGSSEMERLRVLNTKNKYKIFTMPTIGMEKSSDTSKLGWDTNEASRPILVGDLKNIIDVHGITIYDQDTIQQLFWFILNKNGKPEAMRGKHDDHVMSLGVTWQMAMRTAMPTENNDIEAPDWAQDMPSWAGARA